MAEETINNEKRNVKNSFFAFFLHQNVDNSEKNSNLAVEKRWEINTLKR